MSRLYYKANILILFANFIIILMQLSIIILIQL